MNLKLNELTLKNVGQWPKTLKMATIGILVLLVIALGYWLIVKDNFAEYDTLREKEDVLKQEFEQKQRQASSLHSYRNQIEIISERFGNMLKQLPSQNEMPGLLEDISKTGIASGLTFDLFAPMPEVMHDFYYELPIKISVIGNYHQLAIFLSRVAQMSRIVTLHDFTIEVVPKDKQVLNNAGKASGDLLIMKLTANIYRYRAR